jgi:hypothetical protein
MPAILMFRRGNDIKMKDILLWMLKFLGKIRYENWKKFEASF